MTLGERSWSTFSGKLLFLETVSSVFFLWICSVFILSYSIHSNKQHRSKANIFFGFILLLCLKIFFSQFLVYWKYCFFSFSFPTSSTLCYSSNIFEHLLFGDAGINKTDPILAILKLLTEWKKIHNKLTNMTANNCGNF